MKDFEVVIEGFKPHGDSQRYVYETHRVLAEDRTGAESVLTELLEKQQGYERVSVRRSREVETPAGPWS